MKNDFSTKKIKMPWPTKDAMEQIYEMKLLKFHYLKILYLYFSFYNKLRAKNKI